MTAIAERYARARGSSHLQQKPEPCDLDVLNAAGWTGAKQGGIGTSLLALRAEYDSISRMPNSRLLMRALKSMAGTRALLVKYTTERNFLSERAGPMVVQGVVERVLEMFLDPNCPTCTGVGMVGGYRGPQSMCPACGGSTKRRMFWGDDAEELERLAGWLEGQMSEKLDTAQRRIQRLLRE